MVPVLEGFAKPIKDEAIAKGYIKEKHPVKYRKFCQAKGSLLRKDDHDYWVKQMRERIHAIKKEEIKALDKGAKFWERVVIVDDCRYVNELGLGMEQNATLLFLSQGKKVIKNNQWRKHESEALARDIDNNKQSNYRSIFTHILNNDGTLEELKSKVCEFVPIWCGLKTGNHVECQCKACTARRNMEKPISPEELFSELVDLIEEQFGPQEKEDEDDEETE